MLLLFILDVDVDVHVIYSINVYGLHGSAIFSLKSLGCHFGVHVLDWRLEKFCSFNNIANFGILLEITALRAREPLVGGTRVRCRFAV